MYGCVLVCTGMHWCVLVFICVYWYVCVDVCAGMFFFGCKSMYIWADDCRLLSGNVLVKIHNVNYYCAGLS